MSQVSGSKFCLLDKPVDSLGCVVQSTRDRGVRFGVRLDRFRKGEPEESAVCPGIEECSLNTLRGYPVTKASGYFFL